MIIHVYEMTDPAKKSALCERILRALPAWFGIEASLTAYVRASAELPLFAAASDGEPVGFATVKPQTACAAEIYVMGILPEYHRHGIGAALIERCEQFCRETDRSYLTVKTLDASAESEDYARTRRFYRAMGFCPLEVFPLLWDEQNPCLFLAKQIV